MPLNAGASWSGVAGGGQGGVAAHGRGLRAERRVSQRRTATTKQKRGFVWEGGGTRSTDAEARRRQYQQGRGEGKSEPRAPPCSFTHKQIRICTRSDLQTIFRSWWWCCRGVPCCMNEDDGKHVFDCKDPNIGVERETRGRINTLKSGNMRFSLSSTWKVNVQSEDVNVYIVKL